ncbi:hypothetical protein BJ508DRAFT_311882 [Ascobolus immersus RN42]|uniref:Uncharacterized protein n=1 Tax=Ascobolus immersus RN42 TaxID=1160509 RepID=A0A3N4HRH9_ASCIM|nr:hypothetical protein BJ508DRAFT_311882 [Ascobolus immersus RN42]
MSNELGPSSHLLNTGLNPFSSVQQKAIRLPLEISKRIYFSLSKTTRQLITLLLFPTFQICQMASTQGVTPSNLAIAVGHGTGEDPISIAVLESNYCCPLDHLDEIGDESRQYEEAIEEYVRKVEIEPRQTLSMYNRFETDVFVQELLHDSHSATYSVIIRSIEPVPASGEETPKERKKFPRVQSGDWVLCCLMKIIHKGDIDGEWQRRIGSEMHSMLMAGMAVDSGSEFTVPQVRGYYIEDDNLYIPGPGGLGSAARSPGNPHQLFEALRNLKHRKYGGHIFMTIPHYTLIVEPGEAALSRNGAETKWPRPSKPTFETFASVWPDINKKIGTEELSQRSKENVVRDVEYFRYLLYLNTARDQVKIGSLPSLPREAFHSLIFSPQAEATERERKDRQTQEDHQFMRYYHTKANYKARVAGEPSNEIKERVLAEIAKDPDNEDRCHDPYLSRSGRRKAGTLGFSLFEGPKLKAEEAVNDELAGFQNKDADEKKRKQHLLNMLKFQEAIEKSNFMPLISTHQLSISGRPLGEILSDRNISQAAKSGASPEATRTSEWIERRLVIIYEDVLFLLKQLDTQMAKSDAETNAETKRWFTQHIALLWEVQRGCLRFLRQVNEDSPCATFGDPKKIKEQELLHAEKKKQILNEYPSLKFDDAQRPYILKKTMQELLDEIPAESDMPSSSQNTSDATAAGCESDPERQKRKEKQAEILQRLKNEFTGPRPDWEVIGRELVVTPQEQAEFDAYVAGWVSESPVFDDKRPDSIAKYVFMKRLSEWEQKNDSLAYTKLQEALGVQSFPTPKEIQIRLEEIKAKFGTEDPYNTFLRHNCWSPNNLIRSSLHNGEFSCVLGWDTATMVPMWARVQVLDLIHLPAARKAFLHEAKKEEWLKLRSLSEALQHYFLKDKREFLSFLPKELKIPHGTFKEDERNMCVEKHRKLDMEKQMIEILLLHAALQSSDRDIGGDNP